jgi:hypothetical protein
LRVLFDQGTPNPLRKFLADHDVATARERGWSTLKNGDLLDVIESEGYDLLVTTDTNLKHQQNVTGRGFGIVVLRSTSWPRIQRALASVVAAIDAAALGSYTEVEIPE